MAAHAVELLRETLTAAAAKGEKVTLVPLAPLTNIALLLRTYPMLQLASSASCSWAARAGIGNATAAAEFNVWHDPEAAAIVLSACHDLGVTATMYGLDVFYDVEVSLDQASQLSAGRSGTAAGLAGRLIRVQVRPTGGFAAATIGDAGAVCAVVDPDGLRTSRLPVRVELSGTWTRGRTVADARPHQLDLDNDPHGLAPTSVDVAVAVDGKRYADLWLDTMRGPGR